MLAYIEAHPDGQQVSRAGLFLGKVNLAQGEFDEARRWWQWTVDNHGDTLEGHKSRYKLAVLAMIEGDADAAREQFAQIASNPDGPLAPEAAAMQKFLESPEVP